MRASLVLAQPGFAHMCVAELMACGLECAIDNHCMSPLVMGYGSFYNVDGLEGFASYGHGSPPPSTAHTSWHARTMVGPISMHVVWWFSGSVVLLRRSSRKRSTCNRTPISNDYVLVHTRRSHLPETTSVHVVVYTRT